MKDKNHVFKQSVLTDMIGKINQMTQLLNQNKNKIPNKNSVLIEQTLRGKLLFYLTFLHKYNFSPDEITKYEKQLIDFHCLYIKMILVYFSHFSSFY